MTTKLTITNDSASNGDAILNAVNSTEGRLKDVVIRPGESRELWISTASMVSITETWPVQPKPDDSDGGGSIIAACGDKGEAWAKAFVQRFPNADEDTMRAWFANAIEAADTVRRERRIIEAASRSAASTTN
jgi:hypothetical protein